MRGGEKGSNTRREVTSAPMCGLRTRSLTFLGCHTQLPSPAHTHRLETHFSSKRFHPSGLGTLNILCYSKREIYKAISTDM